MSSCAAVGTHEVEPGGGKGEEGPYQEGVGGAGCEQIKGWRNKKKEERRKEHACIYIGVYMGQGVVAASGDTTGVIVCVR